MRVLRLAMILCALSAVVLTGCSEGDPELEVSPSQLEFQSHETSKELCVRNVGDDDGPLKSGVKSLDYDLYPSDSWVSSDRSSGSCGKDETDRITVSINRSAMPTGVDSASIAVSSNGGDQSVPIHIDIVTARAELCPSAVAWSPPESGGTQSINVTNCGNGDVLSWSVTDDADWLSESPTSGVTPGSFTITASANTTGSTRTGTVTVSASGVASKMITVTQDPVPPDPVLCVSQSSWNPPADGGTRSISVTNCGNDDVLSWSVTDDADWLSESPTSGSTPGSFTITASANTTGSTRTGTVTVSASGVASKTVTVTQDPVPPDPVLCVSPSSWNPPADGGTRPISVTNCGNDDVLSWSVTHNAGWLSESPTSGVTPGSFTITASANTTGSSRTGTVTVSSPGLPSMTITVTQDPVPPDPVLCVSPSSWNPPADGGTQSISVTNCGNDDVLSWSVTDNAGWLSESPTSGVTPGRFTITASANTTGSTRTGTVTVSAPGVASKTVTVTQDPVPLDPVLCVSPSSWNPPADGGTQSISVTNCGNDDVLSWSVTDNAGWLSESPTSGVTPGSFTITASANTTGSSRTGTVTVSSPGLPSMTVTVTQPGVVEDGFEENDSQSSSNPVLSEDTWYNNLVQCDDDWYKINVTSGYERVLVDCRFTDADGDIDIQLVNSSGTVLATSSSTTNNEYIDYCVPSGGTYYILVYYDDECSDYSLWWDDIVCPCADDGFEENDSRSTSNPVLSEDTWYDNLVQDDDDWYKIDVTSGYERVLVDCRFTDAEGDIDIQLVNSSGTVLATSSSTTNNEYIDYCVPSGGTYYILVYYDDECSDYSLWWDDVDNSSCPCIDDGFEPNDSRSSSDPVLSEDTWYNGLVQDDDDWYKINVTSGYERVLINCQFTDADGDIDIRLVNSSGTVLAISSSTTDDEYIDHVVPSGGTYYIRVYYDDACNVYSLWWDDVQ